MHSRDIRFTSNSDLRTRYDHPSALVALAKLTMKESFTARFSVFKTIDGDYAIEAHDQHGEWIGFLNIDTDIRYLAAVFAEKMAAQLGENLGSVIQSNKAMPDQDAAHDFLDANTVMEEAFKAIFGHGSDPASQSDTDLINRAWDLAKNADYDCRELTDGSGPEPVYVGYWDDSYTDGPYSRVHSLQYFDESRGYDTGMQRMIRALDVGETVAVDSPLNGHYVMRVK